MKLQDFSQEDLDEWRAATVGHTMRECLSASLRAQHKQALQAYWEGNPWPEAERLALRRAMVLVEDLFEASADDVKQMMEHFDEFERNQAG